MADATKTNQYVYRPDRIVAERDIIFKKYLVTDEKNEIEVGEISVRSSDLLITAKERVIEIDSADATDEFKALVEAQK